MSSVSREDAVRHMKAQAKEKYPKGARIEDIELPLPGSSGAMIRAAHGITQPMLVSDPDLMRSIFALPHLKRSSPS